MAIDLGELPRQNSDDQSNKSNVIDELDWRRGRRMAIDMTAMYDDVIVDVDQIVTTGGIFDAFTTDTGSDDSFLASLDMHDVDRRRFEAPTTPSSLSSRAADGRGATERSSPSLTADLGVASTLTANCVVDAAAVNHHIAAALVGDSVSAVDAVQSHGSNPGDVAAIS